MTAEFFVDLSPARPLTGFRGSLGFEYPAVTALVTTELRSQKLREREILEEVEVGKGLVRDTGLCVFNFSLLTYLLSSVLTKRSITFPRVIPTLS